MLNLFIILLLYIQKNASGFYSPQNNKFIKNKQRIHIINNIINSDQTLNLNGNSVSNNGNHIIVNGKKRYLEKTSFRMSPDDQGNDNDVNNENEFLLIDCISILIAAQLLGLNDAITDPDFLKNGGFAAPIPLIPKTLNVLITRVSQMEIAWLTSSNFMKKERLEYSDQVVKPAIDIWFKFCVINLILQCLLLITTSLGEFDAFMEIAKDGLLVYFREVWFVLPIVIAFRFFYASTRPLN